MEKEEMGKEAENGFAEISDKALDFIRKSIESEGSRGLRIDVIPGGCQGMTYELNFVNDKNPEDPSDLSITKDDVTFYIASRALVFVSGMSIDYVSNAIGGNLVFNNPNALSCCGCGRSFCAENNECGEDKEDGARGCYGACCY
ncbi:MAG: iron-sulfur cluster assembly accessory protein [Holosporaceae bacterium]|jgi:iron-sulfur cluster assembly protein|nr:iron-sulfur cluster assembly accessory protein [Holosporaceae bacterium]